MERKYRMRRRPKCFWKPIVNHGGKSQDKQGSDVRTAKYLSTIEMFLEYVEAESGKIWRSKRTAELDGWL